MTCKLLPLERDERAGVQHLKDVAKAEIRPAAEAAKGEFIERKAAEIAKAAGRDATDDDRDAVRRGIDGGALADDWVMWVDDEAGEFVPVTVREILANPTCYHRRVCLDPLEPDYDGGRPVAMLFTLGGPARVHSFARGGRTFRLMPAVDRIELRSGREAEAAREAAAALARRSDIYLLGGQLALQRGDSLERLGRAGRQYVAGSSLQFYRKQPQPNGGWRETDVNPPRGVLEMLTVPDVLAPIRPADGVITAPTMRLDGAVLSEPGYDAETRLVLALDDALEIRETPSLDDAIGALDELRYPWSQFPYASDLDRAVMLAGVLTAVVRAVLPTAPIIAGDAAAAGSGKTLMMTSLGVLAGGVAPMILPIVQGAPDEQRKRLMSVLAVSPRSVLQDNIVGIWDCPVLAAMLTSESMTDRILGCSETATLPNRTLWLASGNNLTPAGDLTRRVLISRIDPGIERPFAREFAFNPTDYVKRHRLALVRAALTVLRAYRVADPAPAPGALASFEAWDAMVRQPVAWLARHVEGLADPMDAVTGRMALDPEQERWGGVLEGIRRVLGQRVFETRELAEAYHLGLALVGETIDPVDVDSLALRDLAESLDDFNTKGKPMTSRSIGRVLTFRVDRVVGGLSLRRVSVGRVASWKLEGGDA